MSVAVINDTFWLKTYRSAWRLLGPILPFWVKLRAAKGKEDPARLSERRGIASAPRPEGPLIWMHGASVGECTLLLPVIAKLRSARPDISILVTSATRTAADLMQTRLPEGCLHQYVPLDKPNYVAAFLEHWQPSTAVWVESEIWPHLILGCKAHGIKTALINARMSARSIAGWAKRPASAQAIFSAFDMILAANDATASALSTWTGEPIRAVGNLKHSALPLPANAENLEALKRGFGARKIWCAASTHKGEDQYVLSAHKTLQERQPRSALILAPRHPERAEKIMALIKAAGMTAAQRSKGELPHPQTDVYLFDTIGEMGLAFRLSQVTVVCGSFISGLSGHNPLEPAVLGSAVLSGPHVSSFAQSYADLCAAGGAKLIAEPQNLAGEIDSLLSGPAQHSRQSENARRFLAGHTDVLRAAWDGLAPLLPQATP